MRFAFALAALCLCLFAAPARAQSCYGGAAFGQSYQDTIPVQETTVTTTRSYSLSSQSFAPALAPSYDPGPSCAPARSFAPSYAPSCGGGGQAFAPNFAPSRAFAAPAYVGGGFDTGVGFGGSSITAQRGVRIRGNSAAALNSTFGGAGLTINARRVRIRGNR